MARRIILVNLVRLVVTSEVAIEVFIGKLDILARLRILSLVGNLSDFESLGSLVVLVSLSLVVGIICQSLGLGRRKRRPRDLIGLRSLYILSILVVIGCVVSIPIIPSLA